MATYNSPLLEDYKVSSEEDVLAMVNEWQP